MLRYKEIRTELENLISAMYEGEKIPSRPELCRLLDTARTTVDRAVQEMMDEGLLEARKGSGTYVTARIGRNSENDGCIGVVVPNTEASVYQTFIESLEKEADSLGRRVFLCISKDDPKLQGSYIRSLVRSGVSGFILVPVIAQDVKENCQLYDWLTTASIPFVFCIRGVAGVSAPTVASNDFYGGYIGTNHLIRKGYRNIAFIATGKYTTSENRCYGYLTALMESGFEVKRGNIILEEPQCGRPRGYDSMKSLLENDPGIDAVFCFNDSLASGIYSAISDSGKRVGKDIGVISYDNTPGLCDRLVPALTSLSFKSAEMGQIAVRVLHKMICRKPVSAFGSYLLHPSITVRQSCEGKELL